MFLRSVLPAEPPHLVGDGVSLRAPLVSDHAEWAALRAESRAFLAPWEPIWPSDDLSRPAFRRRIRRYASDMREDRAYPFLIFRAADGALVGGITLANVSRNMSQSASCGYWVGQRHARQGYMTAALRTLVAHAFDALRLHRLEAACLPHNEPSRRLLERAGFRHEGLARGLVCIAGQWADHLVYARLSTDR